MAAADVARLVSTVMMGRYDFVHLTYGEPVPGVCICLPISIILDESRLYEPIDGPFSRLILFNPKYKRRMLS